MPTPSLVVQLIRLNTANLCGDCDSSSQCMSKCSPFRLISWKKRRQTKNMTNKHMVKRCTTQLVIYFPRRKTTLSHYDLCVWPRLREHWLFCCAVLCVSLYAGLNLELQQAQCQPVVTGAQGNLQTLNTVHPVNESPGFHYHVLSGEER